MSKELPEHSSSLVKLADGTVKQRNMLTGTEVWTVPGRGHRPLAMPPAVETPIDPAQRDCACAFCPTRYLETPPEKSRLVLENGQWRELQGLRASALTETTAAFRRVPNLFEIVSFDYWTRNHDVEPSPEQHRRMAEYLSEPAGYDHVLRVVRARLAAYGASEAEVAELDEETLLRHATGFFAGGHDLIIGRRHYTDQAETTSQLASSGTLTPDEHAAYTRFTARSMRDLYDLSPHVRYVAAFQNWLKPAGASFDHLHKQLVAIDEYPVATIAELDRLYDHPDSYEAILKLCATRGLLLAQNDAAVAMVGVGHRYPTIAVWPLGDPVNPWDAPDALVRGVSDLLHAVHAATGADVATNEEWYHRPRSVHRPMRWRVLLKWRISTLAGFEGGTRIYLNTLDPWAIRDRVLPRLNLLRESGAIAPMRIGAECKVSPSDLAGQIG
ncbi:DUF4921 family protein [Nanchangia anserum]|uniref:DUF4921 family protein n=1 Tax=Nanchangia anserum TaxID=2692125 RepID=A0A8I0GAK5_9ACTO|nr:DUF4921 family protein [Nanchangia anserum]MBD3689263.1 DUF4921 family protein [Nanchangia anserum]QOX81484.1 DUF4921 family protein [Nanchangia anserum]